MDQLDRRQIIVQGLAALIIPAVAGCTGESTRVTHSTVPGTHFENRFFAFEGDVVVKGFANDCASTHLFEISISKPGTYRIEHANAAKGGSITGVSEAQTYKVIDEKMTSTFQPVNPWANGNYMMLSRYTESRGIETQVVCIQYAQVNR